MMLKFASLSPLYQVLRRAWRWTRLDQPVMEHSRKLVHYFILLSLTALILLTATNLYEYISAWVFLGSADPNDLISDLIAVAVLLAFWWSERSGYLRLVTWGYLIMTVLICTFSFDITTLDQALIIYALPILTASFILSPPSSFVLALLSIAGYTYACLANHSLANFNYLAVLSLCVIAALAWLISAQLNSVIERSMLLAETLRQSQDQYRSMFENVPVAIYRADSTGKVSYANPAAIRMLREEGYPGTAGVPPLRLEYDDSLWPGNRGTLKRLLEENGEIEEFETVWVRDDGARVDVLESARLVQDRTNQNWYYEGIAQDITLRKRFEEALMVLHQRQQNLLKAITSILIGINGRREVSYWNSLAEETFGIPAARVVGRPFFECPLHWDWEALRQASETCQRENKAVHLDRIAFTRKDGKDGLLGLLMTPLPDAGEDLDAIGFLLNGRDITEQEAMERQLAQAQKLKSIGQLAAGIAHEINTPIQYIGDNIYFLKKETVGLFRILSLWEKGLNLGDDLERREEILAETQQALQEADADYLRSEIPLALEQSLEGIEQVRRIVSALKEFSHPGGAEKVVFDLNRAVESTITVARTEWKYVAEVETDFDSRAPVIMAQPGEINQVVLNLLVNAAHAIADHPDANNQRKGLIRVSTRSDGEWAQIEVADNGCGIDQSVQENIFDPFFTTKEVGRGSGQGLAIVHDVVVTKHGGRVEFRSEVGKGTTFTIYLPVQPAEVEN